MSAVHAFSETDGASAMTRVRVIGIGSPFGDDRIGWAAIEALEASGILKRFPPGLVDACCCDRPGGGLLTLFEDVGAAVVIDAMVSDSPLGTVRRIAVNEAEPGQAFVSSHGIGIAETLALGKVLNLLPTTLLLYGIEARYAAAETALAPQVRDAIPELLQAIEMDLELVASG